MSDPKSMGEAFMQRRAAMAAAAASKSKSDGKSSSAGSATGLGSTTATTTTTTGNTGAGGADGNSNMNMSMADIQREQLQQREQQKQQQQQLQRRPQLLQQRQHPMDEYGRLVRPQTGRPSNRDSTTPSASSAYHGDEEGVGGDYNNSSSPNRRGNNDSSGGGNTTRYPSSRGGGRGGGGGSTSSSTSYRKNLPIEQGVIHSLLDKFGFILCADRDRELFFHYSEYSNNSTSRSKGGGNSGNDSDELNIGDEVEFRIGLAPTRGGGSGTTASSGIDGGGDEGNEKMSAYEVRKLPRGTIYWESEDEPKGKRWTGVVEKVAGVGNSSRRRRGEDNICSSSGGGGPTSTSGGSVGTVRIISEDDGDDAENSEMKSLDIYYNSNDVTQISNQQRRPRRPQLERGDTVEFTLVTERRTKHKFARDISLIRSERERQREEEEKRMLENAKLETGVVVSTKGDFGFLRSTCRLEQVYFHASHVILPIEGENGDGDGDGDGDGAHVVKSGVDAGSNALLAEGQEVEFYVIDESKLSSLECGDDGGGKGRASGGGKNGGNGKSLSARRVKMLPKGTVKFEHIIAQGVTGLVTECPINKVVEPFGRSERCGCDSVVGKIRLQDEVLDNDGQSITEVLLRPEIYPGGSFAISRTGSELGTWIRPGDVLLFDIVKQVVDGTCHAEPTKFVHRASLRPENDTGNDDSSAATLSPTIRLIEPSLCGRTEGVVRSIHDNYGFIQLAERNVDAYFPLFEVFPAEIHADLVRNNPDVYTEDDDLIQQQGGRIHLEVGMEVAFDLSLQVLTSSSGGGRDGGGRFKQSRPVQDKQSLRARRVQVLPRGSVREKIAIASGVPATVTKADTMHGSLELDESVKVECVSQLRHPLVARLIRSISNGKFGTEKVTFHDVLSETDSHIVTSMVNASDDLEWSYVVPENSPIESCNRRICITRKNLVYENSFATRIEAPSACDDAGVTAAREKSSVEDLTGGEEAGNENSRSMVEKQDSQRKSKGVKSLRYDKFSFPDMSDGPPGVGDVVTCDLYLSRRSGTINIENITIVERKTLNIVSDSGEHGVKRTSLSGFVSEVVPSRQFGFITAVDENGNKTGGQIFFHYKEVGSFDNVPQDQSPIKSNKFGRSDVISKGDEVTFDAGPGKNGKLNASNISILPRGTLKQIKADSSSPICTGYILIEPSRTLLMNTPSHTGFQSASGQGASVGRWTNVRDEPSASTAMVGSSVKGEGVILLLTDPSYQFSSKPNLDSPDIVVVSEDKAVATDSEVDTNVSSKIESEHDDIPSSNVPVVGTHLGYKFSSLATRGNSTDVNVGRSDGPKRGDLVSFSKAKGSQLVKDIRIEKLGAATRVTGTLTSVDKEADSAIFVLAEQEMKYNIKLTEVVSCDKALINELEKVDGILHEGKIFGVCRTKDIHLSSSFGSSGGLRERPKLNLTVKKELKEMGGQIMAQSRMAKGPDGTTGFDFGWTTRVSAYAIREEDIICASVNTSLSASASEFVPNFAIAASGFDNQTETT